MNYYYDLPLNSLFSPNLLLWGIALFCLISEKKNLLLWKTILIL